MLRLTGLIIVWGFGLASVVSAQEKKANAPLAQGKRHALLVGVSKYPNLAERLQLYGSANDVLLLRSVLTKSCDFKTENIRVLSEAEGEAKAELLPSRANIAREFKKLADTVQEGDYVFISLSGHGSQQPEHSEAIEREPDGLDEIFLPRDVGKWDNKKGAVTNAILDDELGAWLQSIRDRKASVMILVDACHSGTITRGNDTERKRQLSNEADLGIPKTAIQEAVVAATDREKKKPNPNRTRSLIGEDPPLKLASKDGLVAIYAAQASEPTVEIDLPNGVPTAKPYGILTYSFCQILTESASKSKRPLTYREIAQRIHLQYSAWGRTFPTPVIEGADQDRQLFGMLEQPGRSGIQLRKTEAGYTISGGSLHGVTRGSIFGVYPPPGKGDELVGYAEVEEISVAESKVKSVPYGPLKEAATLPAGGICKVVSIDFGDLKRTVGVDPLDDSGQEIPKPLREQLMTMVRKLDVPESLIRATEDPKKAAWLVRVLSAKDSSPEPKVVLVPAGGVSQSSTDINSPAFGPPKAGISTEDWLKGATRAIAKVENLKQICARESPSGDTGVQFEVSLKIDGKEVALPITNLHAFNRDKIEITVKNVGRTPIDISILYTDSSYGIDSLFPDPKKGEYNRLRTNEKLDLPAFRVSSKTVGIENLLILAVEKTGEAPVDFKGLAQPALGRLRGDATGIERLIGKACFGVGKTRALEADESEAKYAAKMITWTIHKENRPK